MSDFKLVWKNLMRRKLRTFLMLFAILIAFMIFGVLAALEQAFDSNASSSGDRLMIVNKINFTQPLPISYVQRVRALEGVKQVAHMNWFGGYYQEPRNQITTFAVDPGSYIDVYQSEFEVPDAGRRVFLSEKTSVIVGKTAADKWGWKVGDHIPLNSNIFSQKNGARVWDVTVAAIVTPKKETADANFIALRYDYFDETRSFGKDQIGWMALTTTSAAYNDRLVKQIDEMFANSPYETSTDTEKAFSKAFVAQLGNIALMVGLVVGAAFITILMIVGNTMAMAVRERTREIGVLKTLGFPGPRILKMVLGESLLLAVLGGVTGMLIAAAATTALRGAVGNFVGGLAITPVIMVMGAVMMLLLGLITGLMPAMSAMRLPIVQALGRS
ncbi:MAG: transporter permease [Rhodospirillales bacterium]|nr:transporter permease [Rhodospirillales bacterium]